LLIGCAAGGLIALIDRLQALIPEAVGGAAALPVFSHWSFEPLRGTVPAFVAIVGIHTQELFSVIYPITLLLLFRLLLRRTGLAFVAVGLVGTVLFYPDSGSIPGYIVGMSLLIAIFGVVLFRAGLLAVAAMMSVNALLGQLPLTPHPAGWYAGTMLLSLAFIVAPAAYGFWTSQAGRPLFRDEILGAAARR
jgi:hypothetical protein